MARTRTDIKLEMTTAFMANETLAGTYGFAVGALFVDEFSSVSFENILFDVVSYSVFLLEQLFDRHKQDVDKALYEQKAGTLRWYQNKAKAFQDGFDLWNETDQYDNTGFTEEQIEASKIVKYCSVKEGLQSGLLTIKVAKESGGALAQLAGDELERFNQYISEIRYAGVKYNVVNNPADKLVLIMDIYRDVLVLDSSGTSVKYGGKPVETAIDEYMKSLPFDGELVLNDLIEILRAVEGVNNAHIKKATYSSWNSIENTYTDPLIIDVKTIPVSGYFVLENFDFVNYVV